MMVNATHRRIHRFWKPISVISIALCLLWRHVGRRTENSPLRRHGDFSGIAFGQSEIHDMRLTVCIQDDVA